MEESCEVHSDDNRTLPEKKQKRIVKTPAQVEALEKFYNEHKYPSEAMKLQLAEKIGLTEKQVSGWFCHRRLKDKRTPNDEAHAHGKQDRSSGVIQDRGSGLRQDSCGSTKQGDNRHCDPKEVESRRITAEGSLPPEPRYELGSRRSSSIDDTSSGSSSPLQDRIIPQNVDPFGVAKARYPTHHGNIMPMDAKGVKRTGPSGYLKVKGQVENAAITAVKMQLGRHYREDGPPLGIEFEQLPPGAFETSIRDPVHQPYYVGETTPLHSFDDNVTFHQSNPGKMYERYNSKSYRSPVLDETSYKMMHGSRHREKSLDHPIKPAASISNHSNPFPRRNSPMEMNEDSGGENAVYDVRENSEMRSKRGLGAMKLESLSTRHPPPYGKKVNSKQAGHWSHNYDNGMLMPKVSQSERIESKPSNLTLKRGEFFELEDRGLSRKNAKEVEVYEERRGINEYPEPVPGKNYSGIEVAKRNRGEFPHQKYARKESMSGLPPRTNKNKRSAAEMPSSFSEDETAETSTSGD